MKNIAVFASGGGSNTIQLIDYFKGKSVANISLIVSNKKTAGILSNPTVAHLPKIVFNRSEFHDSEYVLDSIRSHDIDFIVLAGFLWKIPNYLIEAFPNNIINIHPALLPSYGGKGMFGMHVHRAVYNNKESQSGMTIHYVNSQYDAGAIIFQATCDVRDADSPEEVASRVLLLEHTYYGQIYRASVARFIRHSFNLRSITCCDGIVPPLRKEHL